MIGTCKKCAALTDQVAALSKLTDRHMDLIEKLMARLDGQQTPAPVQTFVGEREVDLPPAVAVAIQARIRDADLRRQIVTWAKDQLRAGADATALADQIWQGQAADA